MITLEEQAYAKLNLTLDVVGKREDGYHDLDSVMQSISMYDDVEIDLETGEDWKIQCDWPEVPDGPENLAWKAAGVFYKELGKDPQGITIRITKRIPTQAGLAGGSADAAAVLRALNNHEGKPFNREQLLQLGAKVGSDVPFCIFGGTARATGRGEKLEQLIRMPDCFYCICKPKGGLSTPLVFAAYDAQAQKVQPGTEAMLQALEQQDLEQVAAHVDNALEGAAVEQYPVIAKVKQTMLDCGAMGAAMTGAGSAVFGMFPAFDLAAMASMELMKEHKAYLSRNVEAEA